MQSTSIFQHSCLSVQRRVPSRNVPSQNVPLQTLLNHTMLVMKVVRYASEVSQKFELSLLKYLTYSEVSQKFLTYF